MVMSTPMSYSTNPKTVRARLWRLANPERWKAHQQRYQAKKRKPCKLCGKPMPKGLQGRQYHKKCARLAANQQLRNFRTIAQKEFQKFKESQGCSNCGYNRCGACLDYHHKNPATKECRILARDWKLGTPRILAELEKCVLLCKNCHYEEHYLV